MASPNMLDNEDIQSEISETDNLRKKAEQAFQNKEYDVAASYYRELNLFTPLPHKRKQNSRKIEECTDKLQAPWDNNLDDAAKEKGVCPLLMARYYEQLDEYQELLWKKPTTSIELLDKRANNYRSKIVY